MSNVSIEPLKLAAASASPRVGRQWAYIGTGAVAAVSILAAVAGDAILARAWTRSDFLLYNSVNRFLTLVVGAVCFQFGFGIVRECRAADPKTSLRVLANACLVCGGLWAGATAVMLVAAAPLARFLRSEPFAQAGVVGLISAWLFGHTLLHLVVSWLRARHDVAEANHLALFCRAPAVLGAAAVMLAAPGWVPGYYGLLGGVVSAACLVPVLRRWDWSAVVFDRKICRNLIVYSSSRCADGLLRQASLVVLTAILFSLGRGETAGELGILQTLIRGMESLFQPLVLLVLADSFAQTEPEAARRDVQRLWTTVALLSIPATLGLIVAGEFLIGLWLGENYRPLGPAFRVTALSVLPTIGVVLLRGHLDSRWAVSPLAWINAGGIALTAIATCALDRYGAASLMNLAVMTAAVQWAQFLVQFALLKHACGLKMFDAYALREVMRRIRRCVHR